MTGTKSAVRSNSKDLEKLHYRILLEDTQLCVEDSTESMLHVAWDFKLISHVQIAQR